MGKILVIAEKPSVGRDIARVLKCTIKGDGFLSSGTHAVSWAVGHLAELCEPEDYAAEYKSWRAEYLPIIPDALRLRPIARTAKQFGVLKRLMNSKDTDSLVCATDSGREGELIFRYIYGLAKCTKPFRRLWISSMTDAAVKRGFDELKDGREYDHLYDSARCRSEADWLVGINATRAYTLKYNTLLSVGRVQTPTLALMTERRREIDTFVPVDYYEVTADFITDGGGAYSGLRCDAVTEETKILSRETAEAIAEGVRGARGVVEKFDVEQKSQPPPLLYDLTELQRDCNRRFGFSAQKTLSIAQDLYEKRKLITYPRTNSRYLPNDMSPKLESLLLSLPDEPYGEFVKYLTDTGGPKPSARVIDDTKVTDHHAIIPTGAKVNTAALTPDEAKVFDLIARRFIAVFYPRCVYNAIKIFTAVRGESFLTKGSVVVQPGYTVLYPGRDASGDAAKADDAPLPDVSIGDAVTAVNADALHKKTKPPPQYTEATLLSAMEHAGRLVADEALREQMKDSGLGTPATRAAIIERLLAVGYIVRAGRSLSPTEKGMKLIEVVPDELKSAETTGKWERGLSLVAEGKMDPARFMGSIERYVRFIVERSQAGADATFPEEKRKGRTRAARKPAARRGRN